MTMEGKGERLRGRPPLIRLAAGTHLATFSHKGRREMDPRICRVKEDCRIMIRSWRFS
jgi:hypothetical protein